jgi:hypothetical protein
MIAGGISPGRATRVFTGVVRVAAVLIGIIASSHLA